MNKTQFAIIVFLLMAIHTAILGDKVWSYGFAFIGIIVFLITLAKPYKK